MGDPEISRTATEAPANEPGVWEEPSRSWVPVLTRSDLRCMLGEITKEIMEIEASCREGE